MEPREIYREECLKPAYPGHERRYVGRDVRRRECFQHFVDGVPTGSPVALLGYEEYQRRTREAKEQCMKIQVRRWSAPIGKVS